MKKSIEENSDIDISHIIKIILILSSVFSVIGGYLYVRVVFYFFSISTSGYFSINDYITSSLDISVIGTLYALSWLIPNKVISKNLDHHRFQIAKSSPLFILYCTGTIGILGYYVWLLIFHCNGNIVLIGVLMFLFFVQDRLRGYFRDPFNTNSYITAFIIYMFGISILAYLHVKSINDPKSSKDEINVNFAKTYPVNHNPKLLRIIMVNSEYYFFYDLEDKKVIIMPKNNVNYIEKIVNNGV